MSGVYVVDTTGSIKQTGGGGGLTSPVAIADGGTGQTSKTPAFDALSPLTTTGDIIYYNGTDNVRLAVGSSGQVLTVSGGNPAWAAASGGSGDYIHIREEQTAGTNGGTFTNGSWQTRVLNTEVSDAGGHATLASNQITLAAGTYIIRAWAYAGAVGHHQARFQNVTDGTTAVLGLSCQSTAAANSGNLAVVVGRFIIASSKTFEMQHQCQTALSSVGFGVASNFSGTTEVYTTIELTKVA